MNSSLLVLLLLSLLSLVTCVKWHQLRDYDFEDYKLDFDRHYSSATEHEMRRLLFENKLDQIRAHNADPVRTWKMGVNHLTDRTEEEFKGMRGLKKSLLYRHKEQESLLLGGGVNVEGKLPEHVDWRDKGIISDVKDQGSCGSCWTFATAETTESYLALSTGKLHVLSEQQILDCTPNPLGCGGSGGCGGGTAELAWAQITSMGGLQSEWTYPYTSYFGTPAKCQFGHASPVAKVSSFVNLPTNEQDPVLNHLATVGPLAINVDAATWSSYETGVFNGCNQTHPDIDHVVQLVGYGTDALLGDYWLVRNSWNPLWGEDGYIRLKRSSTFTCGIDLTPGDGIGCSGGPPTVKVCGTCGVLYDSVYPVIAK